MPTLYNHEVEIDTTIEVDIDLTLREISDLIDDEMGEFVSHHASTGDILEAIDHQDIDGEVIQHIMGKLHPSDFIEEIKTYCAANGGEANALQKAIAEWLPPTKVEVIETIPMSLSSAEQETLRSAERIITQMEQIVWVEWMLADKTTDLLTKYVNPFRATVDAMREMVTKYAREPDTTEPTTSPEA